MENNNLKIDLDNNILKDPIVKELAKCPTKTYNRFYSMNINSDSSKSGRSGNLKKIKIIKRNYPVEYYKKKFSQHNHFDQTPSSLSIQEFIAGELYRLTGCKAPKQKLFFKRDFEDTYNERIDSGSKKVSFTQLEYKEQINNYTRKAGYKKKFLLLQELSRLMGATLCIGDYDRNPRNYYIDPVDKIVGKMDHDRTFKKPLPDSFRYADPGFLVHIYFIEKLCGKSSTTDPEYNYFTYDNENNIRPSLAESPYSKFDDVLFRLKKDWEYNLDFFDGKTIDSIKKIPINTFMFVSYIKSVKNFLDMPNEVSKYLFSPEKLLKDIWVEVPQKTKEDICNHCNQLFNEFQSNLRNLKELIAEPIKRLAELENYLKVNKIPVPKIEIDYEPIVKYIHQAEQQDISLHKLKEKIKGIDSAVREGSRGF